MEERKTIYLCLAHMSEDGMEQKRKLVVSIRIESLREMIVLKRNSKKELLKSIVSLR